MEQKIIQIGSSLGVTIPSALVKKSNIQLGQKVSVLEDENGNFLIKRATPDQKKGEGQLAAWAEEAVERYRPALEALKDK